MKDDFTISGFYGAFRVSTQKVNKIDNLLKSGQVFKVSFDSILDKLVKVLNCLSNHFQITI